MSTPRLREVAPHLHAIDTDVYDKGIHARLRTVVVDLGDDGLLLHSPIEIDDALAERIAALGEVRHLVAPNLNHHLFLAAAKARYPDAEVWGAPGLSAKKPTLPIDHELDDHATFGGRFVAACVRGVLFSNEVLFFHPETSSFVCTDFVQHIQEEPHFVTRQLWKAIGAYGRFAQNRYWRARTKDRAAYRRSLAPVLEWDVSRVVMAHGDVLEAGGREALREATAWAG